HSKKSHEKDFKKKRSFKRKEDIKAFLGEWITDGESSNEDSSDDESKKKMVGIAMHDDGDDEPPLPPPPMCLMARDNSKVNYKAGGNHWMLDSGCTQHMTGYVKMFTSLDEDVGDYEHVTFGDNSKGKVVGLGKVAITKDLSISNVLLVESVSFNLLSIAQLCDLGLICTFSDSEVVVTS